MPDGSSPVRLSRADARRLAVLGQQLGAARPPGIVETVERLGRVQRDPTAAVAPTEHLVLFSRLGAGYRPEELDRLLFDERTLVEYWVHIVPASQLPLHRPTMRRYPESESTRGRYTAAWLRTNATFRRYILAELRRRGPLRSRDLEDRAVEPWRTGGWNDGKNLTRMLDLLWFGGQICIVGRDGRERFWDLAERYYPTMPVWPPSLVADRLVSLQLRAAGVAPAGMLGRAFDGPVPGRDRAVARLVKSGVAVACKIEGVRGSWFAYAELLDTALVPRAALLSPFDRLVHDRVRTRNVFGFDFKLEIYTPQDERRHGYFVLPVLYGDRLVGRVEPVFDRRSGLLSLRGVHGEPDAPAESAQPVAAALTELAGWLGASRLDAPADGPPDPWSKAVLARL